MYKWSCLGFKCNIRIRVNGMKTPGHWLRNAKDRSIIGNCYPYCTEHNEIQNWVKKFQGVYWVCVDTKVLLLRWSGALGSIFALSNSLSLSLGTLVSTRCLSLHGHCPHSKWGKAQEIENFPSSILTRQKPRTSSPFCLNHTFINPTHHSSKISTIVYGG